MSLSLCLFHVDTIATTIFRESIFAPCLLLLPPEEEKKVVTVQVRRCPSPHCLLFLLFPLNTFKALLLDNKLVDYTASSFYYHK